MIGPRRAQGATSRTAAPRQGSPPRIQAKMQARLAGVAAELIGTDGHVHLGSRAGVLGDIARAVNTIPALHRLAPRVESLRASDPLTIAYGLAGLAFEKHAASVVLATLVQGLPALLELDTDPEIARETSEAVTGRYADVHTALDVRLIPPTALLARAQREFGAAFCASALSAMTVTPWGTAIIGGLLGVLPALSAGGPHGALPLFLLVLLTAATGIGVHQRWPEAENTMARLGLRGVLNRDHFAAYFADYAGDSAVPYPNPVDPAQLTTEALLRQSGGRGMTPAFSTKGTGTFWLEFQHCCHLIARAKALAPRDPHVWDRWSPSVSLHLLEQLNWQPLLLHGERLEQVRQLRDQGKRILIVANHRSDLDIPVLSLVLRGLNPRFVTKRELTLTPGLGRTSAIHPLRPDRWFADAMLEDMIIVDRSSRAARARMIAQALDRWGRGRGESVVVFATGTRDRTPVAGVEAGLAPFRSGAVNIADAATATGHDVIVVPVSLIGMGSIMNSDYRRLLVEGMRYHQPVVINIGHPRRYDDFTHEWGQQAHCTSVNRAEEQTDARARIQWMTRALWQLVARDLLPLQHVIWQHNIGA